MPRPAPVPEAVVATSPQPEGPRLGRFEDVVALADQRRDITLKMALERDVHLVRFEEGRIEFRLAAGGRPSLPTDLSRALEAWTGRRWLISVSHEPGAPTLSTAARDAEENRHRDAASHPLVREVLARFPGAQIVDVRDKAPEPVVETAEPLPAPPEAADGDEVDNADN